MKKGKICLSHLILWAATCLSSDCAATDSVRQAPGEGSVPVPFEYRYEKTHPLPASRTIRITSEDANVFVTGSDRADILIQAHYRISSTRRMLEGFDYRLSVIDGRDELRVGEIRRTGTRNFAYDKHVHAIMIEVPRQAIVTIHEEDGSCVIKGIDGGIRLILDDGKVDLKDCGGDIALTMDNGVFSMINCPGAVKYQTR